MTTIIQLRLRGAIVEHVERGVDPWPEAVSDGLSLPCTDCGEIPRFDYHVQADFWEQWVPGPERLGVICLPCLDKRCGGVGLVYALEFIQWTGTDHTIVLEPTRRYSFQRNRSERESHDNLVCPQCRTSMEQVQMISRPPEPPAYASDEEREIAKKHQRWHIWPSEERTRIFQRGWRMGQDAAMEQTVEEEDLSGDWSSEYMG